MPVRRAVLAARFAVFVRFARVVEPPLRCPVVPLVFVAPRFDLVFAIVPLWG